jgi:hypothetical protein
MTKSQFLKECESHDFDHWRKEEHLQSDQDAVLELRIGASNSPFDNYAIILHGIFANGSICSKCVYCPLQGRQHKNWEACKDRVNKELPKFQKWLNEFKRSKGR